MSVNHSQVVSHARQMTRKCPRSRDQRLQQIKNMMQTPRKTRDAVQHASDDLWAQALEAVSVDDSDSDPDDDEEYNDEPFSINVSALTFGAASGLRFPFYNEVGVID